MATVRNGGTSPPHNCPTPLRPPPGQSHRDRPMPPLRPNALHACAANASAIDDYPLAETSESPHRATLRFLRPGSTSARRPPNPERLSPHDTFPLRQTPLSAPHESPFQFRRNAVALSAKLRRDIGETSQATSPMLPRMVRQNRFRPCAERFSPRRKHHPPAPSIGSSRAATGNVSAPISLKRCPPHDTPKPPHAVTSEKVRHTATSATERTKNSSTATDGTAVVGGSKTAILPGLAVNHPRRQTHHQPGGHPAKAPACPQPSVHPR